MEYPKVRMQDVPRRHIERDDGQRRTYHGRDRDYNLSRSEIATIQDVGRFRVITGKDLAAIVYRGQGQAVSKRSLRHLEDQKLIRFIKIPGKDRTKYATLTKEGRELVKSQFNSNRFQEIYSGVKKLREIEHDSQLYRVYQQERSRMREHGCTPSRVMLDYEIKRKVQKDLERERRKGRKTMSDIRQAVAEQHDLVIVNGVIQIPDLRIEYEGEDIGLGGSDSVDVEYVSGHYKPEQIAAKAQAGFTLYGDGHNRGRSSYGPDMVMEILR
jgi:DNA-binding MarR family transcriptional regulator